MTMFYRVRQVCGTLTFLWLAAIFAAGCATSKIDWDSRIGNYSYDQALLDFGPPDKSAVLTDGTRVGEWLTRKGYPRGSFTTFGTASDGTPVINSYQEPATPDHYRVLTFGADGKLKAWRNVLK
jgi:hypothetical protein